MKALFISAILLLICACDKTENTANQSSQASRVLASASDLSKVGQCIKKSFTERIETPIGFSAGDDYEISYEFDNGAINQHSVSNSIFAFNFINDRFDSLKLGKNISFKAKNKEIQLKSCPDNTDHVVLNSFDVEFKLFSWSCLGSCVE